MAKKNYKTPYIIEYAPFEFRSSTYKRPTMRVIDIFEYVGMSFLENVGVI